MRAAIPLLLVATLAGACQGSTTYLTEVLPCPCQDASDEGTSIAPADASAGAPEAAVEGADGTAADVGAPGDGTAPGDATGGEGGPATEAGDDGTSAPDAPAEATTIDVDDASHCGDGVKDADETDVDCGGAVCLACPAGSGCLVDRDCSKTAQYCDRVLGCACQAFSMTCVYDHCFDQKLDYGETAIDCGGPDCAGCSLGQGCIVDADCADGACDAVSLKCVTNQCADHRQDGAESDVDCGGSVCPACASGQHCHTNFDCMAGYPCNAGTTTCE